MEANLIILTVRRTFEPSNFQIDEKDMATIRATIDPPEDEDHKLMNETLTTLNGHRFASKEFVEYFHANLTDAKFYKGDIPLVVDPTDMEQIRRMETCFFFNSSDTLGMRTPAIRGIADLRELLNEHKMLGQVVMAGDSNHQHEDDYIQPMRMGQFLKIIEAKNQNKTMNLLQYGVSKTRVADLFVAPTFVRDESMVERLRTLKQNHLEAVEFLMHNEVLETREKKTLAAEKKRLSAEIDELPTLLQYLIISQKDSFTGAHVDYAGTCTFVHVVSGKKIFFIVDPAVHPPCLSEPAVSWLERIPLEHYRMVEINVGQTLIMKPGVMHFVYTPEDSVMFSGGFILEHHLRHVFSINEKDERLLKEDAVAMSDVFPRFGPLMFDYVESVVLAESGESRLTAEKLAVAETFLDELNKRARIEDHLWTRNKTPNGKKAIENRRKSIIAKLAAAIRASESEDARGAKRAASDADENEMSAKREKMQE